MDRINRIARTSLAGFRPLGYMGTPVQQSHEQIKTVIGDRLTEEHRRLFCTPVRDDDAVAMDWYTDRLGEARRLVDLPPNERIEAEERLNRLRTDILNMANAFIRSGSQGDALILGQTLILAVRTPSPEFIYVLPDGQPALVLWGFEQISGQDVEALKGTALKKPETVSPPPVQPKPTPEPRLAEVSPVEKPQARRAFSWPGWLKWLPLLLLLPLLFFLLRGCTFPGMPSLSLPGLPGFSGPSLPSMPSVPGGGTFGGGGMVDPRIAEERKRSDALRDELLRLQRELDAARAACQMPQKVEENPLPAPQPEKPIEKAEPELIQKPEPPVEKEKPPAPEQKAAVPDDCPPVRKSWQAPEVMLVVDASKSMTFPMNITPAKEAEFNIRMGRGDPTLAREINALNSKSGSRMDNAIRGAGQLLDVLPPDVDVGLVSFEDCNSVVNHKFYKSSERADLIRALQGLTPKGGTPLARAIERAGNSIKGGGASEKGVIVVVTDGRATCNADPCAAARAVKAKKPGVTINVITLGSAPETHCIAENGGGKVYNVEDAAQLRSALTAASEEKPDTPECRAARK